MNTHTYGNIVVHIGRLVGYRKIYVVQLADVNMTMFPLNQWFVKITLIVALKVIESPLRDIYIPERREGSNAR